MIRKPFFAFFLLVLAPSLTGLMSWPDSRAIDFALYTAAESWAVRESDGGLTFRQSDDQPWGNNTNDTCFAISGAPQECPCDGVEIFCEDKDNLCWTDNGAPQECEVDTNSDWFGNSSEIYTPPGGLVIFL
jgi:hypothetical protein